MENCTGIEVIEKLEVIEKIAMELNWHDLPPSSIETAPALQFVLSSILQPNLNN